MTEALAKVREELGTEAIILGTRTEKRGGVLDFMGQRLVEVTAAIDDSGDGPDDTPRERPSPIRPSDAALFPPEPPVTYDRNKGRTSPAPQSRVEVQNMSNQVDLDRMMKEIGDLKSSVKVLADSALSGDMSGLPPKLASLLKAFQTIGLENGIAKRIVRQLLDDLSGQELSDGVIIAKRATDMLITSIGEVSPIIFAGAKPRMVAFVGPTGSGKTTTIAKLAADFTLNMRKDVSILTIDTKRVDAVGQLKAYCRILNIPLNIAYTPDELPSLMPIIMKSDITLIDTPGSGPLDKPQMIEMVEFLQKLVPQEVHLAMSVTTSYEEMKRIHDNFSVLKPNRLLFTKLDETDRYGPLVSFAINAKKPLSYCTFGQNVPGDFAVTDTVRLIERSLETVSDVKKSR